MNTEPALMEEIKRLESERKNLLYALDAALVLTDKMLDEILALHKHANHPLPLKLLQSKDAFDKAMENVVKKIK